MSALRQPDQQIRAAAGEAGSRQAAPRRRRRRRQPARLLLPRGARQATPLRMLHQPSGPPSPSKLTARHRRAPGASPLAACLPSCPSHQHTLRRLSALRQAGPSALLPQAHRARKLTFWNAHGQNSAAIKPYTGQMEVHAAPPQRASLPVAQC